MGLFKKKVPPMWFIMDEPKVEKQVQRQGPYTRETFIQLMAEGRVESTQLIWTSERIFPNAAKPRSARLVRIPEWRRLDQFPDPVLRQLQAEAAKYHESTTAQSSAALQQQQQPATPADATYGHPPPMPPPHQQQPYQQQQAPYPSPSGQQPGQYGGASAPPAGYPPSPGGQGPSGHGPNH